MNFWVLNRIEYTMLQLFELIGYSNFSGVVAYSSTTLTTVMNYILRFGLQHIFVHIGMYSPFNDSWIYKIFLLSELALLSYTILEMINTSIEELTMNSNSHSDYFSLLLTMLHLY